MTAQLVGSVTAPVCTRRATSEWRGLRADSTGTERTVAKTIDEFQISGGDEAADLDSW